MNIHRSVERALETLVFLSKSKEGRTLTEICTLLDAPKTSMNPIVFTLVQKGFLEYNAVTNKYTMGMASWEVGRQYLDHFEFLPFVQNQMNKIVTRCLETSYFATLQGGDVVYLLKEDSPERIRMVSTVGTRFPAYATALGKAMMSQFTQSEIVSRYPDGFKPITPKTITDIDAFMAEMGRINQSGIAADDEEALEEVVCRAIPICRNGKPVAAISVSTPLYRFTAEKEATIIEQLKVAKYEIEQVIEKMPAHLSQ